MKTIATEDHQQLFDDFEAAVAIAFNGSIGVVWERTVDSIGNPVYTINKDRPQHQEAVDGLNACFIGFCLAKGFIGKFEE